MTQSDLDTATLIRRLTEDLEASKSAHANLWREFEKLTRLSAESDVLTHRAMSERDEARRAADACRRTLAGFQLELDAKKAENERLREQLAAALAQRDEAAHFSAAARETWEADFATIDRMLVERTKERDNALANALVIERGRDAVREQLAAIEWARLRRADHGGPLSACCPICQGVKPGHEVGSRFTPEQVGHRTDCWFARQTETIPVGTMTAGSQVRIAVEFKPAPARPDPRFKAGEWVKYRDEPAEIKRLDWDPRLAQWFYALSAFTNVAESFLLPMPQPKFSIGEWVSHGSAERAHGWPDFEIVQRYYSRSMAEWMYPSPAGGSARESEITAQTPQHKHDCRGCVFLGRMGDIDLYYDRARHCGYCFVSLGPVVKSYFGADHGSQKVAEAMRRAKLRGLIQ